MVEQAQPQTMTIKRTALLAAQDVPNAAGVPVMGHLPRGAVLLSSFWDSETGDLHINYRIAEPTETEGAKPDKAKPAPIMLRHEARVVPLERIAMVAHELIRSYHIATTGAHRPSWDELDMRDRLAEMGRCSVLRDERITVSGMFANSNRIPDPHEKALDRVESALRACVVQAFNLST